MFSHRGVTIKVKPTRGFPSFDIIPVARQADDPPDLKRGTVSMLSRQVRIRVYYGAHYFWFNSLFLWKTNFAFSGLWRGVVHYDWAHFGQVRITFISTQRNTTTARWVTSNRSIDFGSCLHLYGQGCRLHTKAQCFQTFDSAICTDT